MHKTIFWNAMHKTIFWNEFLVTGTCLAQVSQKPVWNLPKITSVVVSWLLLSLHRPLSLLSSLLWMDTFPLHNWDLSFPNTSEVAIASFSIFISFNDTNSLFWNLKNITGVTQIIHKQCCLIPGVVLTLAMSSMPCRGMSERRLASMHRRNTSSSILSTTSSSW